MVNWFYPPEYSGAGLQCHRLSLQLQARGIEVDILAGTLRADLVGPGKVDGLGIFRVWCDKSNPYKHLLYGGRLVSQILASISRYDLLHTHGFILPASLAARLKRRPLVQKITNLNIDDPMAVERRRFGGMLMSFYRRADVLIPTSGRLEMCCRLALSAAKRIVQIPNGVDTALFTPASAAERSRLRNKFGIAAQDTVLLTLGPVNYKKGIDVLIRALNLLPQSVRLWVIGPLDHSRGGRDDGASCYNSICRELHQLGLSRRVRFFGYQAKVHEFLRAADIYVHPSRGEGQPNSILEAMASGLPTVANLLPGITDEIIQNGKFGYLIEDNQPDVLAAALRILINNPALRKRLGWTAREDIVRNYSLVSVADRYYDLYRELLRPDHSAAAPRGTEGRDCKGWFRKELHFNRGER